MTKSVFKKNIKFSISKKYSKDHTKYSHDPSQGIDLEYNMEGLILEAIIFVLFHYGPLMFCDFVSTELLNLIYLIYHKYFYAFIIYGLIKHISQLNIPTKVA